MRPLPIYAPHAPTAAPHGPTAAPHAAWRIAWAAIVLLAAEGVSPGLLATLAPLQLAVAIGGASWGIAAWAAAGAGPPTGRAAHHPPYPANDNRPLPRGRQAPSPLAAAIARHYQMQRDRTGRA